MSLPNPEGLPRFQWAELLPWLGPLLDIGGSVLCFLLPFEVLLLTPTTHAAAWPSQYTGALVLSSLMIPVLFNGFGVYNLSPSTPLPQEIIRVQAAWTTLMMTLITVAVLTKTNPSYSRAWFIGWYLLTSIWLGASRVLVRRLLSRLRRQGLDMHAVLLVGDEPPMLRVYKALESNAGVGFRIAGYLAAVPSPRLSELGVRYLGSAQELQHKQTLAQVAFEEIWIAYAWPAYTEIRDALDALSDSTRTIRLVPDTFSLQLRHAVPSRVGNLALLDVNRTPINPVNKAFKRAEDIVLGVAALILLLPMLALIAAAIKLTSPGPVLFRQRRHGEHGRQFWLYKFRTMRVHREAQGTITQARRADDRVHPLGRLLRRTSLDELPQIWNVLKGEMSMVGPRPHPSELNDLYRSLISRYMWRHAVKPGITGWAQINGLRGETENIEKMEQRLEYDLYYIQNWSLWLDVEILLLTLMRGWMNPNAY